MTEDDNNKKETSSIAGTNIDAVQRDNEQFGMSYNEAKEFIAKTTGGRGTGVYSDTDIDEVKRKNQQSAENLEK